MSFIKEYNYIKYFLEDITSSSNYTGLLRKAFANSFWALRSEVKKEYIKKSIYAPAIGLVDIYNQVTYTKITNAYNTSADYYIKLYGLSKNFFNINTLVCFKI